MTLGNMRQLGVHHLVATCLNDACKRRDRPYRALYGLDQGQEPGRTGGGDGSAATHHFLLSTRPTALEFGVYGS
jgi:hypothetical protein